jgi:hypothetical protein
MIHRPAVDRNISVWRSIEFIASVRPCQKFELSVDFNVGAVFTSVSHLRTTINEYMEMNLAIELHIETWDEVSAFFVVEMWFLIPHLVIHLQLWLPLVNFITLFIPSHLPLSLPCPPLSSFSFSTEVLGLIRGGNFAAVDARRRFSVQFVRKIQHFVAWCVLPVNVVLWWKCYTKRDD